MRKKMPLKLTAWSRKRCRTRCFLLSLKTGTRCSPTFPARCASFISASCPRPGQGGTFPLRFDPWADHLPYEVVPSGVDFPSPVVCCTAGFLCLARNGEDMEDREIRKVLDVLDNAGIRYRMVSHDPCIPSKKWSACILMRMPRSPRIFFCAMRGASAISLLSCAAVRLWISRSCGGNSERAPCPLPRKIG